MFIFLQWVRRIIHGLGFASSLTDRIVRYSSVIPAASQPALVALSQIET